MKPQDPHLIELFWGLQKAGLPLTLQDYYLLPQAWDAGFQPQDFQQLQVLCRRLWVKSLADKQKFDDYFEKYFKTWSELSQQNLLSEFDNQKEIEQETIKQPKTRTTPEIPFPQTKETKEIPEIEVGQAVSQPLPPSKQITWGKFTLNQDYFPINFRKLQQGWRYLRTPQREGAATELDLNATIKRICQQGFLLEPVLRPSFVNKTELVLLIDQSNSMMPFAPWVRQLKDSAFTEGRLGDTKNFYFSNIPKDSLYQDSDLLQTQSLSQILPKFNTDRTVVLIISDAGAARGGFNPRRIVFTEDFVQQIRNHVRQIAWLNPLPTKHWQGNTAERIAREIPMFPFTSAGWQDLINQLKGTAKLLGGYYPVEEEWKSKTIDVKAVENRLRKLIPGEDKDNLYRNETAIRNILGWAKQGEAYLHLAYHAAFPLALTPDLLHYLRGNFFIDIPWFAVSELLLSPLCHPAGYQLYEMDSIVRHLLLKLLKDDKKFGSKRLEQLSDALLFYIQQGLEQEESLVEIKDLGEKPEWISLAYTEPSEVAKKLALTLQQAYGGDKAELIRRASLTATFAEPLVEAGFQPLLIYCKGIHRLVRGYESGAKEILQQLPQDLEIEGIKLTNLLEFETVTVNSSGQVIKTETHQAFYYEESLGDNIQPLIMMGIPEGEFIMGSPKNEPQRYNNETPQHRVKVAPFWLAQTPITKAQWNFVANLPQIQRELNFKDSNSEDEHPVTDVSWYDAMEFCARLSRYIGRDYRLPSEAEWEYACRSVISDRSSVTSGATPRRRQTQGNAHQESEELAVEEWNEKYHKPFHFGATITSDLANYRGTVTYADEPSGEYRGKTVPVKSFSPNAFGLYDMHGNVWEWCADPWHENYQGAPEDSRVWDERNKNDNHCLKITEHLADLLKDDRRRVQRGGSWVIGPRYCRSVYRVSAHPDFTSSHDGFRVACGGART